jgi:hypothetical protein
VVDETDVLSEVCGHDATITVQGLLIERASEHPSGAITSARTAADYRVTWSGPTGRSVTFSVSGLEQLTFTETSVTFHFSGRRTFLTIPGEGVVQLSAGRVTLTLTFDPLTGALVDETLVFHGREVFDLTAERFCELIAP